MSDNPLKLITQLIQELNNSVPYCHWKSNLRISDALSGVDDLDILVDRAHSQELLTVLAKFGFKQFHSPHYRMYAGVEDYLGFDEDTGKIVHLHLHYMLSIGERYLKGFHIPIEKEILSLRQWDEDRQVYYSSYFYELLLLILRMAMKVQKRDVFRKQMMSSNSCDEFVWLKERCIDFYEKLEEAEWLCSEIRSQVKKVYNKQSFCTLRKLQKLLYRKLDVCSQGSRLHNTYKRTIRELKIKYRAFLKNFRSSYTFTRRRSVSGGVLISFVGADGSGKSTMTKEICGWLKKHMDVRFVYMGSGDGKSSFIRGVLKAVAKPLKTKELPKDNHKSSVGDIDLSPNRWNFRKSVWTYFLARERINKIKQCNRFRMRGYVVITDRYLQNEYRGIPDGKRAPEGAKRYKYAIQKEDKSFEMAKLIYPDIVIKMIVSPETAKSRKGDEINLHKSGALTERVKTLRFSEHTVCVEVNADAPYENVLNEVKKAVWQGV